MAVARSFSRCFDCPVANSGAEFYSQFRYARVNIRKTLKVFLRATVAVSAGDVTKLESKFSITAAVDDGCSEIHVVNNVLFTITRYRSLFVDS